MIITRTPYRVSFFGGGSDYPRWFERFGGQIIELAANDWRELAKAA